ncbi:MAG: ABC transporter ATP-binding protein, partial [Alphaproteobacteria bacterium]
MAPLLEAHALAKSFGPLVAVRGVSFAVGAGEVLGLLGPNGAGKSTTMKMLTGFLRPSQGRALIAGIDVNAAPLDAKRRLGYLPEGAPLYGEMTVRQFLRFIAAARRLDDAAPLARVVDAMGLDAVLDQSIDTLSKGFRRRVGVAQAIVHNPEVLILDEPTDGLDPNQKHEVRQLIARMAKDKAICVSTHLLEEVEAVCSRAVIIDHGRIVADGTPGELRARSRYHNAVHLAVRPDEAILAGLAAVPGAAAVERDGDAGCTVIARDGAPILDRVLAMVREKGWPVREIAVDPGRLD